MADDKPLVLNIGPLAVPLPRWAVAGFGVVAVCFSAGVAYRQVFPPQPELVTQRQANDALSREIAEYNRHIMDEGLRSEVMFDAADRGALTVRAYADGCVLIQRRAPAGQILTRLVPDLSRAPAADAIPQHSSRGPLSALVPTLEAQGRCLNPHPGAFKATSGARNGCVVEVWREFADGCEHVQLLNTCSNTWATNPDGSPQVRWTKCRH